jgi:hypothetical protein
VGTALPDETTVAYGGSWSSWTDVGTTIEALAISVEVEDVDVEVQQYTAPVRRFRTSEKVAFETVLAEMTGANLALILNGANSDTAAGASQKGYSAITAGGYFEIPEKTWAIEGYRVDTADTEQPVRLQILSGTAKFNGETEFGKANPAGIPLRIDALADTTKAKGAELLRVEIVTAPATS